MKLSLACALVAATVAQLAGASAAVEQSQHNAAVERSFAPRVVDGHLHMLSSSKHRRHHNKKRATGYCKPKSSAGSAAGSGSTSSNTVSASSSSSSSSSAQAPSSTAGSSGGNSNSGSSSSSSSSSNSGSSSSSDDDDTSPITSGSGTSASSLGSISQFQGTNSGIGSWFKTNAGSDHTNGQSWCQTWYQDSWMGFAPSVGLMLSNFGGDYNAAAKAYCGREVKFTNPNNGKTAIGFIADGFDDTWAKRSGNTDLTVALFTALYGSFDNNKNTVIQNLQWELTGNVVQQGTFQNNKYSQ